MLRGRPIEGLADANAAWMKDAACRGHDTNIFFPERGKPVDEARLVCSDCPVKDPCRDYAVRNRITIGMFGNTTPRQRRDYKAGPVAQSESVQKRMVWLADHGWFASEIAREFGVSKHVVRRVLAKERKPSDV